MASVAKGERNLSMQPPSNYRLHPPNGLTPESWLYQYDNQPRVIPRWPESRRMTLVVVIVEDLGTSLESDAVGYVLTDPGQADRLVDFSNSLDGVGVLFFSVPRGRVIKEEICPGLTSEAWDKPQGDTD